MPAIFGEDVAEGATLVLNPLEFDGFMHDVTRHSKRLYSYTYKFDWLPIRERFFVAYQSEDGTLWYAGTINPSKWTHGLNEVAKQ